MSEKLYTVKCDEEMFFIQKLKNNRISFHVGYTEFEMSKKELQKLIDVLKEVVVR